MRWIPFAFVAPGCSGPVAGSTSTATGFTVTSSPAPSVDLPSDVADLELGASLTEGVALVPDVSGDGADDFVRVAERFTDGDAIDILEQAIEIRPNLLWSLDHTILVTSTTSHLEPNTDGGGTLYVGVHDFVSTPDVTGDERPDAWLLDSDGSYVLAAGPFTRPDDDPDLRAEVSVGQLDLQLAADLDGDGDGELVGRRGESLVRCEGLFYGALDTAACPAMPCPEVVRPRAIGKGDLDADGIIDLLVAGDGSSLLLVDGNFADGEPPLATVVPHTWSGFTIDSALAADLDGDGIADLAWVEDRSSWSETEGVGVAILHNPLEAGSELDGTHATLGIFQPSDATVHSIRAPDTDADGTASLLLVTDWRPGGLLFDASVGGSLGPNDADWVLAPDQTPVGALTGELDGDDLDDILLKGVSGTSFLYLGASLP